MTTYEEVVDFIDRVQELERFLGIPPEGDEVRGDEVDVIGIKKLLQEHGMGFALREPVEKLRNLNNVIHSTEDDCSIEDKLALIEMQSGMVAKWCEQLKEVAEMTDNLVDRKSFAVTDDQKAQLEIITAEMEVAKIKAEKRRQDVKSFQRELVVILSHVSERVAKLEEDVRVLQPVEEEE
uniref:Dynein regulatory complex protein 10 n=1 Tax=Steinernema glaseri TaxID=37863 RepID=A0A1I7YZV0_9BILA